MLTISIGKKALLFSLPNSLGEIVSLEQFLGRWVVLYFYPKDNTPGCTIESIDFSCLQKDFEKLNAVVLGISPDSLKSHCNFVEKQHLTIILLSDPEKKILKKYGVWGKKKFMGREYDGVLRTTVLVDPMGRVACVWENVSVKGHAAIVLQKLKQLFFLLD